MTLLVIIGFFWGVSALIRMALAQRHQRELERIKAEQRRAKQAQSEQLRKQIEQDREMLRLRREQEKERKEREAADAKLAKEQEKQAAQLEKHEKRIEQLEWKVRKLDRDIQAQKELLGDYYGQLDWLQLQQSGTTPGGKEFAKYQDKIVTKQNQIRKAENKLADMTDAKERAEEELST